MHIYWRTTPNKFEAFYKLLPALAWIILESPYTTPIINKWYKILIMKFFLIKKVYTVFLFVFIGYTHTKEQLNKF